MDHAKQSAADAFKTASKRAIQKIDEATDGLIGNKTAYVVAKSYKDGKITRTTWKSRSIMSIQTEYKQNIKRNIHTTWKRQQVIDERRLI